MTYEQANLLKFYIIYANGYHIYYKHYDDRYFARFPIYQDEDGDEADQQGEPQNGSKSYDLLFLLSLHLVVLRTCFL